MFSKIARKNRGAISLSAQLTAWYFCSAFLLILLSSVCLYWILDKTSEQEDDRSLGEKISIVRSIFRERGEDRTALEFQIKAQSATKPFEPFFVRVIDRGGKILAESEGMSALLPQNSFPAPGTEDAELGLGAHGRSANGKEFRVLSAVVLGSDGKSSGYVVQVATDRTLEEKMLIRYREVLWFVLGAALVCCALVGHGIARRGLAPLERITAMMQGVRSTTLDERLKTSGFPTEISVLASTFNDMLSRLQDAFERLSRFSSDIAHELRTPVNNLLGEVEVTLAKGRAPAEYRTALESALDESLRLKQLIDSLLFVARADHPETQIQSELLDISRELATIKEFYEAAAADAGVNLNLDAPGELHGLVDRVLFQRAVGNLIENALANTNRGGSVALSAALQSGELVVSVGDTGCGIEATHLPHVFNRFYRVGLDRSKHKGGLGLGLAIVSSIAKLHHGEARIESEYGLGTRVTISFRSG